MIEILAKLPARSGLNEYRISELLGDGLDISQSDIWITKDDVDIDGSVKEIMQRIFSVSKLSDAEKDIMRHMALIPLSGTGFNVFEELTEYSPEDKAIA